MWDPDNDPDYETAEKQFEYEQFKESELMEKRIVDRSSWGKGEWDNEPDRVDFIHAGFSCFMLRGPVGSWCGYVGVPKGHPAYEVDYSDLDSNLDVHGGITYASKCKGAICHIPAEGMPDDVWWLGFDTAHYWDKTPVNYGMMGLDFAQDTGTYRNVEYVTAEIKRFADQLKEIK